MSDKKVLDFDYFNIDTLTPELYPLTNAQPVTSLGVFEPNSKQFDRNGLFSTEIFGEVGTKERSVRYGRIDLHCKIFNPLIYKHIKGLNPLYDSVMSGTINAVYDDTKKDLVAADEGGTGMFFFQSVVGKIEFRRTESEQRDYRINIVMANIDEKSLLSSIPVLEAGLRDYSMDDAGNASEDEINSFYRKLLSVTTMMESYKNVSTNDPNINRMIYRIQCIVLELYTYIVETILGGPSYKNKFIAGKWSKRNVQHTTGNVLASYSPNILNINDPEAPGHNSTTIGLYQFISSVRPVILGRLRRIFIDHIFSEMSDESPVFDTKKMTMVRANISKKTRDKWTSYAGSESILVSLLTDDMKSQPVKLDDYYMCLVEDDGVNIKLYYGGITPEKTDGSSTLRPLTYYELFHMCMLLDDTGSFEDLTYGTITRYPITWEGSIYVTDEHVETTLRHRIVNITDINGKLYENVKYSVLDGIYFRGMGMNRSKLANAGADMDGDMGYEKSILTDESKQEAKDHLNDKKTYMRVDGELVDTMATSTVEMLLSHMTRGSLSVRRIESTVKKMLADDAVTVDEYLKFCKSVSFIEQLAMIFVVSGTEKTFLPPPSIGEVKAKLSKEFDTKYGTEWRKDHAKTIEYVNNLKKADSEWLKDDPTKLGILTNKKVTASRNSLFLSMGTQTGIGNRPDSVFVEQSADKGITNDKKLRSIMFNKSILGSYSRGKETQEGGEVAKNIIRALASYRIIPGDCGSNVLTEEVYNPDDKTQQFFINSRWMYRNKKLMLVGDAGLQLGDIVKFRNVTGCKSPNSTYCEVCCGKLSVGYENAITLQAAQISGILLTIPMKAMHNIESAIAEYDITEYLT